MKNIKIRLRLDNDTCVKRCYEKTICIDVTDLNVGDKIILGSIKMRLIHKTYIVYDEAWIFTTMLEFVKSVCGLLEKEILETEGWEKVEYSYEAWQ